MGLETRPEQLPRHREVFRAGPTFFPTFVSHDTVIAAGFNYFEPSFPLDTGKKSFAMVHLAHTDEHSLEHEHPLNLVVIRDERTAQERQRVDYYFGTFRGVPRGEAKPEEVELYDHNVRHVYSRHHRVAGSELEALIRNAAGLDK